MTTEIIEYSETERALTLLREQYGKPFDVTTKAGMEAAQRQKDLDEWIDGLAEQVEAGMMTIREALLVAYRSGSSGN